MANWGVVLARNPVPVRSSKKPRHPNERNAHVEKVIYPMSPQTTHKRQGHIFKNLCGPDEEEHDCAERGCERITINVSGLTFITKRSILEAHPTTVLGDPEKRKFYYDHMREEYFFDRHRPTFESIFNYYQYGGKLKRPPTVSDDIFLEECEFFEVEQKVVNDYKTGEGYTETKYEYPSNPILAKVWALFEYPETSKAAFVIGVISVVMTIISIITFTIETLPRFRNNCAKESLYIPSNFTNATSSLTTPGFVSMTSTMPPEPEFPFDKLFFVIETICNVWFTLEAIIRFISCPSYLMFLKDIKNIVDIMAIVPYYVALGQMLSPNAKCDAGNDFAFLRVIRLIRVFKLTKHSQGLQILLLTFQSSMEGLTLFVLTLMLCVLVFSSMIYYCEIGEENTMITSIPDGFWWAVITMCTVGYGDVYPTAPLGKVVGAICALSGVLTLAIPVPIITENFNKFYVHKQRRGSRQKGSSKPSLILKAHERLMKAATVCQKTICCEKNDAEEAPENL